jgi:Fibronectin type III domain
VSSLALSGLFIGALLTGLGLNAVSASPIPLLDYYSGVPDAPSAASAVSGSGNGTATLHWHVPSTTGGSAITSYIVTPFLGFSALPSRTVAATPTTAVITGLANGKKYSFKVAAHTTTGTGPRSAGSNIVTIGAPTAPRTPSATPGNHQVRLRWFAPTTNNGAPIVQYVVTPYRAGIVQTIRVFRPTPTTVLITGLSNGVNYRFRVTAKNARGASLPSDVTAPVLIAGVPSHPTGAIAERVGPGQLSVSFTPGPNNGAPITAFIASCVSPNGGTVQADTAPASPVVVTGLTPNKLYICKVSATNSRGTGLPSGKAALVIS